MVEGHESEFIRQWPGCGEKTPLRFDPVAINALPSWGPPRCTLRRLLSSSVGALKRDLAGRLGLPARRALELRLVYEGRMLTDNEASLKHENLCAGCYVHVAQLPEEEAPAVEAASASSPPATPAIKAQPSAAALARRRRREQEAGMMGLGLSPELPRGDVHMVTPRANSTPREGEDLTDSITKWRASRKLASASALLGEATEKLGTKAQESGGAAAAQTRAGDHGGDSTPRAVVQERGVPQVQAQEAQVQAQEEQAPVAASPPVKEEQQTAVASSPALEVERQTRSMFGSSARKKKLQGALGVDAVSPDVAARKKLDMPAGIGEGRPPEPQVCLRLAIRPRCHPAARVHRYLDACLPRRPQALHELREVAPLSRNSNARVGKGVHRCRLI